MLVDLIGSLGSIAFAISGVPAAAAAIQARSCAYPPAFLALWGVAEVLMMVYAALTGQWILYLNYGPNALCLAILVYFNTNSKEV